MSKPPRRSIVSSFGALSLTASSAAGETDPNLDSGLNTPPPRVPAGVIGATQRTLSDIREERDRLKALVESGAAGLKELDPALIDPSPFPDRLADDSPAEFEAFRKTFLEEGQQIPIQVRPHSELEGRYQVIYGHRRVRAARDLGVPVKALVRSLSDSELVVAQGLENGSRQDLTWIERALFAWRMENAGIKPRDIKAALSLDDQEMARMRSVWRALPIDLITMIGRAPKVGRPRWLELAGAVGEKPGLLELARKTLSADKVLALPSDERFREVLGVLQPSGSPSQTEVALLAGSGDRLGRASFTSKEVRLVVDRAHAASFAEFLRGELPSLMDRYLSQASAAKDAG
ncbi:plasmid partitioning protein RepB [Bosea sp. 2RAB26]|uniref:plasmid partitioning protein RepB n=1 Tax=Bosea sp. 2RAB26 TaxID=3237476 RepID=UPI003F8E3A65